MKNRSFGVIVTSLVAGLAVVGVLTAFLGNASPYVTVSEARKMPSDRLHLAGKIDKASVYNDVDRRQVSFNITDQAGETVKVVYQGAIPPNMGEADQVVAIGGMKGEVFFSKELLVKCPSRYEDEKVKA